MRTLLLTLALTGVAGAINTHAPLMPDPVKTPGDVLTTDPKVICKPGYTQTVRNVPQSVKEQVYRSYGITSREPGEYEIDHLISLELGGSNSVKNLWPESYKTQPLNAHVKDKIENKLHDLACKGKITFAQAQQMIAHNWQAAYVQFIGPLPGGVTPPQTGTLPAPRVPTLPNPTTVPVAGTAQGTGQGTGAVPPNPDGSCPASAPVKVSRSGIYHLPSGDPDYNRTRAQSCFTGAAAAQAAGYRASRR